MYSGIPAFRVVGPTGIPSISPKCILWMSGDPNWVFPIGIRGNGAKQINPLGRLPTHCHRALGAAALGKNIGDLFPCRYHGHTSI